MHRGGLILALCGAVACSAFAEDWAQWNGPGRDGKSPEKGLLKSWPEGGPRLLWQTTGLGSGFSSVAIAGDSLFVTGMANGQDILCCVDLNGKKRWDVPVGPGWAKDHPGSRSTPTVDGERVYARSGNGTVVCVERKSGRKLWSVDTLKDFDGKNISWGITESMLVDGQKLICTPGGQNASVVALDKLTGKTIWATKGLSELSGYCSPISFDRGGRRMVVTMLFDNIVGIDMADGRVLWKHPHTNRCQVYANTPLVEAGKIFCTSGYGQGSVMLGLSADGSSVTELWKNKTLDCHHGGVVLVDGHVYGTSSNGRWVCLEWAGGAQKYVEKGAGKGSVIWADGMLYCYGESGVLVLTEPTPQGFKEISRVKIQAGSGPHWAHPTISGGRLYVRHGEALMVFDIAGK